VLHAFADANRPRGLVVVISDFLLDPAALAAAFAHLRHAGHQLAALHVLDRAELQLPYDGVVEVDDLETGKRVVVEIDAFRAAYRGEVQRHLDQLRQACLAQGGTYHLADTAQPVDATIRAAFAE
jgi:hypothetical protein